MNNTSYVTVDRDKLDNLLSNFFLKCEFCPVQDTCANIDYPISCGSIIIDYYLSASNDD